MPSATPRGYPYPLPTEPVAEGAAAIRSLAEFLDVAVISHTEITAKVLVPLVAEDSAVPIIADTARAYDGKPILIEFWSPLVETAVAGNACVFTLWDGATKLGRFGIVMSASTLLIPVLLRRRLTPTAGNHTYIVKGHGTTGTAAVWAGSTPAEYSPASLRIKRAV